MTKKTIQLDDQMIAAVCKVLQEGKLVAMPTETVYGLAGDAFNDLAVAKIYDVKQRPHFNPLIAHCHSYEMIENDIRPNGRFMKLAETFWPGPLTIVIDQSENARFSELATAGLDTVAIRMPKHPTAQRLIQKFGRPLVAPSANPSTRISPTMAQHVVDYFHEDDRVSFILEGGDCHFGLESTIVDVSQGHLSILRPGTLTKEEIEECLGEKCEVGTKGQLHKAPGQMARHYAPQIPIRLNAHHVDPQEALLAFGEPLKAHCKAVLNLSPTENLIEAAANLFKMMKQLDTVEHKGIAVMPIPLSGIGTAINDRLTRASSK